MRTKLLAVFGRCLPTLLLMIAVIVAMAQGPTPKSPPPPGKSDSDGLPRSPYPNFDLDFPGGTPVELVQAIEKAAGEPLNAIINPEDADYRLPALKMRNVSIEDLFRALELASAQTKARVTGTYFAGGGGTRKQYQFGEFSAGFRPQGNVWVFRVQKPVETPDSEPATERTSRFFQLEPYLAKYKVEDITTAIQTAWQMRGDGHPPVLRFHQETKMLIAVGEPQQLRVIDDALAQLDAGVGPRTHLSPEGNTDVPGRSSSGVPGAPARRPLF